jgi:site-specific DNA recombinase
MRTVAYPRVSTCEQSETFNAEQQSERLKATGADEIFVNVESGKSDDRSDFKRLMQSVRDGTIQKVVITRLDRFKRQHSVFPFFKLI